MDQVDGRNEEVEPPPGCSGFTSDLLCLLKPTSVSHLPSAPLHTPEFFRLRSAVNFSSLNDWVRSLERATPKNKEETFVRVRLSE